MNDAVRSILARRSVRAFDTRSIAREDLETILQCARSAPSAMNTQNWHFTVLQDPEAIAKVNAWIVAEVRESGDARAAGILERSGGNVFRNAPCVVVVSTERADRFGVVNAAAATENMLIAAQSLGIASCWIGMVGILGTCPRADTWAAELGAPKGYAPFFGVTLGYGAGGSPVEPPRRDGVVTYK